MSDNEKGHRSKHSDTVIRNHVVWSLGASFLIPVPIADVFAVSALQLDMIRQLCRVYDQDFSESQGKAIVSALTSSTLARAGARSLIKLIPGIGTLIGGITVSVFNGASTYALGEVFKKHFETGGTILDFDVERLKKMYKEKFEKGKKVAEQLNKEEKERKKAEKQDEKSKSTVKVDIIEEEGPSAAIDKMKELAELKEQGIIDDDEFKEMKKKIIEDM